MDILLAFAFGILNVFLFYIIINIYKRKTGIDLLKDVWNNLSDILFIVIGCFVSGPLGTIMIVIFAFYLWIEKKL
jgi:hypothetical protein